MTSSAFVAPHPPLKTALFAATLAGLIATSYGFGVYLFASLMVDMKDSLGLEYTHIGLITGGAQAVVLVVSFSASFFTRFLQGWKICLIAAFIIAFCMIALSMCSNALVAALLLIFMGGSTAAVYVPMTEIISLNFRFNIRARIFGLASSGAAYGVFFNGLLVSFFLVEFGWRWIWMATGAITTLLCIGAFFLLRQSPQPALHTAQPPKADAVLTEATPKQQWITKPVIVIWALAFFNGLTLLPFQTYLTPFMREELGISVGEAGMVWSTLGAVGMFSGFLVGWLADKASTRTALLLCYTCLLAAGVMVYLNHTPQALMLAVGLFALAYYPVFGLLPTYIELVVPAQRLTQSSGVINGLVGLGGVCGNILGGIGQYALGTFAFLYIFFSLIFILEIYLVVMLPKQQGCP